MTSSDYQRATDVLRAVLRIPAEGRREFLDRECGSATALRSAVESMLLRQQFVTVAGSAAEPDATQTDDASAVPSDARKIGAYTVLDVLGEGGMGVVYRAQQASPRRTVALKIVRPTLITPRMLQRFEHESQMLGRLQHPGIAQVYEAGTADAGTGPQPFFAMEYVRGVPLNQHCTNAGLGTRQRLGLFIKVCEAVQHAHQHGIIHRDLKPGNILVDQHGQPKILDFGVARATDAGTLNVTLQTEMGQLVGTLPYMSPEQVAGDPSLLDTRSDVYSLGVMLYELLAGKLPHNVVGKTIPEAARVIEHEEPTPLSSIDRVFRGDLQTIVGKALDKDKSRRYQSASDLAGDLIRYLHDEPILARPPSAAYQLTKFARRNRGLVAGAVAGVMLLGIGVIGTSWQAVRATHAERDESLRRVEAEAARADAEHQRDVAKREAAKATAVTQFLQETLSSADPNEKGRGVKLADLLDDAAKQVSSGYEDKPDVAAALRSALANAYNGLGLMDEAFAQASAAVEGFTSTQGIDSDDSQAARLTLGRVLRNQAKFEEARGVFQALLDVRERQFGLDDVRTRAALEGLAWTAADQGKLGDGERLFGLLAERAERALGADHADTLKARRSLGEVLLEDGKFDQAEPILLDVRARVERTVKPGSRELISLMEALQQLYRSKGDYQRAIEFGGVVLDDQIARYGADHPATLVRRTTFARTLMQGGRTEEAAAMLRKVLEVQRVKSGRDHFDTLTTTSFLADALQVLGDPAGAVTLRREVAEARTRTLGADHNQTLIAWTNLAYMLQDVKGYGESESILLDVLARRERIFGSEHNEVAVTLSILGSNAILQGNAALAEERLSRCVAIRSKVLPEGSGIRGISMSSLGEALRMRGKLVEAEPLVTTGAEWVLSDPRSPARNKKEAVDRVVKLYEQMGKRDRAAEWQARLLAKR